MTKVIKSTGELEEFSSEKLINSMVRAGANRTTAEEIEKEIETHIKKPETTDSIHEFVLKRLKSLQKPLAANYNMRRAICDLGPSGFPFEQFVSEIFKRMDYKTETNLILKGKCVSHEVDVTLSSNETGEGEIAEVKFHNKTHIKSSVKVPLYVKSRFEDIKYGEAGAEKNITGVWIVTNTKFSESAVRFAECNGIKLLAWDYPKNRSLSQIIDELKVHPITALTTISEEAKTKLVKADLVLCSQIIETESLLNRFKQIVADPEIQEQSLNEIYALCGMDFRTNPKFSKTPSE